jgi:osmotically inducible protein OsmC
MRRGRNAVNVAPGFLVEHQAFAVWKGSGNHGSGRVTTRNGALREIRYAGRIGLARINKAVNNQKITCTEELIAAAHAVSFSMALSDAMDRIGFPAERITTIATVTSANLGRRLSVTSILLDVIARIPGAKKTDFIDAAVGAKTDCIISRLMSTNISLKARLES